MQKFLEAEILCYNSNRHFEGIKNMAKFEKINDKIQRITINNPRNPKPSITWTNITCPGKTEIEFLRKEKGRDFQLSELQASSAKAKSQRPEIRKNSSYFFIIMHFPVYHEKEIAPAEIEFFIGHGFLYTLHDNRIKAVNDFFNFCKKNDSSLISYRQGSSAVLLYELLSRLVSHCYSLLDQNNAEIEKIEKMIFSNRRRQTVLEILSLRRKIISTGKIIQNHKNILKKIMEMKSSLIPNGRLRDYYYELIEHTKTIWEYSETQKETITALHDTNESLLNYNLGSVMKTLTIFSVIIMPLNLIAAIFTMSTEKGMPLLGMANDFWIVVSLMALIALGMLLIFAKKKWL